MINGDAFPVTVDSICASPAATTPALKSTFGVKPSVCSSVCRKPTRETTLLTCNRRKALVEVVEEEVVEVVAAVEVGESDGDEGGEGDVGGVG